MKNKNKFINYELIKPTLTPGNYKITVDFLGDLPEKLNITREKAAEIMADEIISILGLNREI